MYTFKISTGEFSDANGNVLTNQAWAGNSDGRNNPDMTNVKNVGPLPVGKYTIGAAYDHTPANGYSKNLGPVVMNLNPDPSNEMFDRGDFRIHGASISNPAMSSDGCIILPRTIRELIASGLDKDLEVVA